jgi:hypothetical protein
MAQFPGYFSASGIWTLKKQKRAAQGANWPPLQYPDFQFNYVTMLLPGNGTNGAQNNTFLDSSTNNFTITRNGNTTQGTFAPYGSNWGNYFDGTGDWLSSPSNAAFDFGSGNFTIEFWFYVNSAPAGSSVGLLSKRANESVFAPFNIFWSTTNVVTLFMSTSGSSWEVGPLSTAALTTGTWYHLAVTRSSNTVYMFLNGTSIGSTGTLSGALMTNSSALTIGAASESPASVTRLNGYISNLRFVKGTALYTANFTVPTSPLTAVTNTSLLTCQSNRFIDNSTNALTITRNGDTSIQRFSPFNPTAPYAAGTDGGSGYFDGSGDYLNTAYNSAFSLGTGAFTVEAWVYLTAAPPASAGIITLGTGAVGGAVYSAWSLFVNPSLIPSFYRFDGTEYIYSSSTALTLNAWSHIAVVRDGSNNFAIFLNGTRVYSATVSQSFANVNTDDLYIARFVSGGGATPYYPTGYINDCRVIKGSAQYSPTSTTLTVPTAPLTAITNTSLLLSMTNAGILDNAEMSTLETVGNAQISTAQSKFGGGSIAFDGTGDALALPANVNLAVGSGDFTLEMWVYGANNGSIVGGSYPRLFALGTAQTLGCFECYNAAGTMYIEMNNGSAITFTASTLLNSTWNHFAIARSGSSVKAFVNGTQVGAVTNSVNLNLAATTQSWIGAISASAGNFNGYIDDLRITKGYARYTANFTPPTAPFPLY